MAELPWYRRAQSAIDRAMNAPMAPPEGRAARTAKWAAASALGAPVDVLSMIAKPVDPYGRRMKGRNLPLGSEWIAERVFGLDPDELDPMENLIGSVGVPDLGDATRLMARFPDVAPLFAGVFAGRKAKRSGQATGWTVGADGKPRFEIDDSVATLDLSALKEGRGDLSSVMQHDELFENYPQLRGMSVRRQRIESGAKGGYDPRTQTIVINESLPEDEAKSVVMHEVQHAVQALEGFALGGSPEMLKKAMEAVTIDPEYLNAAMFIRRAGVERNEAIIRRLLKARDIPQDAYHDIATLATSMDEVDLTNELKYTMDARNPRVLYDRYRSLMGEVEARNVQTRLNLPADERLAIDPELTEDPSYPRSRQRRSE